LNAKGKIGMGWSIASVKWPPVRPIQDRIHSHKWRPSRWTRGELFLAHLHDSRKNLMLSDTSVLNLQIRHTKLQRGSHSRKPHSYISSRLSVKHTAVGSPIRTPRKIALIGLAFSNFSKPDLKSELMISSCKP